MIEDGPRGGELNMAIDMAILAACELREVPPTLRLYSWEQPTLTVGYAQDIDREIDLTRCRELGISVVRRPTGGRALLHSDEMTYSFIAPVPHSRFPPSLKGAYNVIARALLAGLHELGVKDAVLAKKGAVGRRRIFFRSPSCLSSINHWEIEVQGAKLVGSAQRRTKRAFLHHGSILITCDRVLLNSLFKHKVVDSRVRAMNILNNKVITLSECLGKDVVREEVSQAIKHGFSRILSGRWVQGSLSSSEVVRCVPSSCSTGVIPTLL